MIRVKNIRFYSRNSNIRYSNAKRVNSVACRVHCIVVSGWQKNYLIDVFGLFKVGFQVFDSETYKRWEKLHSLNQ